jgi:hypothetical protein
VLSKQAEECSKVCVSPEGQMERCVGPYRESVAFHPDIDVSGLGEIGDDALRDALGDVQLLGDLPDLNARIAEDQQQGIAVIGEESELRDSRHQPASNSSAELC